MTQRNGSLLCLGKLSVAVTRINALLCMLYMTKSGTQPAFSMIGFQLVQPVPFITKSFGSLIEIVRVDV